MSRCMRCAAKSVEYADAPSSAECVRGVNYPSAIICNRIPEYLFTLCYIFSFLSHLAVCNLTMRYRCEHWMAD